MGASNGNLERSQDTKREILRSVGKTASLRVTPVGEWERLVRLGLHLPAHLLHFLEHPQHISAQNLVDVLGAITAVE